MYAILNVLVFLLLTGYAVVLMLSKPSYVKLSKREKVLLTGREKFLLLTMLTGMIAISGAGLSSIRLMIWMMMMILAFILYYRSPRFNRLIMVYVIFLLWLAIELVWSPSLVYGIRVYLKYLYPLIVLFFAATFVRSEDFIFIAMRWMLLVSLVLSVLLGGLMTKVFGIWSFYLGGLFWPMSTLADYLAVMSAVSFVMWWRTKEKKYLLLIGWFIIASILQGTRTGILSIGIMMMVGTYLRYRLASLPYLVGAVAIGFALILFVPQIKEKMFYESHKVETISDILASKDDDNLNTNARAYMWEYLLREFHEDKEWMGSGLGSVQHLMYESYIFGGLKATHSDYIQLVCDVGNIGLLLYLLFPLSLYFYVRKYVHKRPRTALRTSAILAVLSYAAVLPAMGFDNVVNYSFASHSYPFIFIGIFLAYQRQEKLKRFNNV